MTNYTTLRMGALRRLADAGDEGAKAELARRSGETIAPTAAPVERKPRTIEGWQRPLASSRYGWWPPQVGETSFEMQQQATEFWSREREREERAALASGRMVRG